MHSTEFFGIIKPAHTFALLSFGFLAFSFSIYLRPSLDAGHAANTNKRAVSEGRLVWQRYNCQSCHQLYGLGGYLGPDLTNVYSTPGKGENWVRAMLKSGVAQMPVFEMPEKEIAQLITFLKAADASGSADPRNFSILPTGMTKRK